MGKTAFIFPGQGSQYVGMAKDFYESFEESKAVFEKAADELDFDIKKLCFEENEDINKTEYTQAIMLTAEIAMYEYIKSKGIEADVYAGLSLGEYSALVASGVMSFEDAVKVVRQRGLLMQNAVEEGKSGMSAIIGLDCDSIKKICDSVDGEVEIANVNCPGQIVISGEINALTTAEDLLKNSGARRVVRLNVSGAFHSKMLVEAGEKLYDYLSEIKIKEIEKPYVCNTYARYVNNKEEVCTLLKEQVYSTVKWQQCIEKMIEDGVDTFVEIGPGKSLSNFIRKIDKNVKRINIEKISDLDKILHQEVC